MNSDIMRQYLDILKEAVNPYHASNIHAGIENERHESVQEYAKLIEDAVDNVIHNPKMYNGLIDMRRDTSIEGHKEFIVIISLKWHTNGELGSHGGEPRINVFLDKRIVSIPQEEVSAVKEAFLSNYRANGWIVDLTDGAVMFKHVEIDDRGMIVAEDEE